MSEEALDKNNTIRTLSGKTALVTGSTSGIGLAIARRLAREGADVVLHGLLDQFDKARFVDQFSLEYGVSAILEEADFRDAGQIEDMVSRVLKSVGQIDIVVNNAGMQHVSPIADFPPEKWNDMLAVNLSATFHTTRLLLPAMVERNWGRIVNIASISGLRGRAGKSAYNATKHGLIGLTKSIALEVATTGVTCNAICPGWVLTDLVRRQIDALAARDNVDFETATTRLLQAKQPSGKFVTTEQVAALCHFLCTDDASETRGVAWAMDGATTAA